MTNSPQNVPRRELQEKDFIQDSLRKNPFPFWIWFVILTTILTLLWGWGNWYSNFMSTEISKSPFLQVTNRQFSVFLWQFPEHMRIHSKNKQGYLTGFQYESKNTLVLDEAENYVVAPPNLVFLYHTWQRLISQETSFREIPINEFKQFLAYAEEWQPRNWPNAPKPYEALINSLVQKNGNEFLSHSEEELLPLDVRLAFQGWKNYFKEADAINEISVSYIQMRSFLKAHPHYARNYWQNIMQQHYPNYLISLSNLNQGNEEIPKDEIAPFLRVAFFNFSKANSSPALQN